jgi:hypothetical protein
VGGRRAFISYTREGHSGEVCRPNPAPFGGNDENRFVKFFFNERSPDEELSLAYQ